MAKGDNNTAASKRISEKQRYRYIGFEVFPGQPKDLFKNDAERQKLVENVKAKRASDETIREDCTLLEERVSFGEKIILAVSSLCILGALLLPWYSVYTVVPSKPVASETPALPADSAMMAAAENESPDDSLGAITADAVAETTTEDVGTMEEDVTDIEAPPEADNTPAGVRSHAGERANEQIITAHTARASTMKEYEYLSGLGTFTALGSVGGAVFGSGVILMITGVLMIIFALLCIGLPIVNLYALFGLKGQPDDTALQLKKLLKLNWLPLIIFGVTLVLSFIGADYGFNAEESYASLGDSYSVATFLGTLSWGVFVSMAASILVAVKAIEI